jgi:hypothetical protein
MGTNMNDNSRSQAKARDAYQKRRLRAKYKAWKKLKPDVPDVRPSIADWQPLERGERDRDLIELMQAGLTFRVIKTETFANDKWFVIVNEGVGKEGTPFLHIWIEAHDKRSEPTWAECQAIKNQVLGADQEMVQLYPSERRVMNSANVYHLWGVKGAPLPLGLGLEKLLPNHDGDNGGQNDGDGANTPKT